MPWAFRYSKPSRTCRVSSALVGVRRSPGLLPWPWTMSQSFTVGVEPEQWVVLLHEALPRLLKQSGRDEELAPDVVRDDLSVEAIRLVDVVGADVTLLVAGEDWRVTVSAAAGEPRRQSCVDASLKAATLHRVDGMVRMT